MSVSIESSYATFYYRVILTDILFRTISKLSQIIVEILELCVFEPPSGA